MSDNEIRMITNSINEMRQSFDTLRDVVNSHCIEINKKMSDVDNRVKILESEKPKIEIAKQRQFEWLTKFMIPFLSPFISALLAVLVFKLTKG